jgi:hypothetical protein
MSPAEFTSLSDHHFKFLGALHILGRAKRIIEEEDIKCRRFFSW